MAGEEKEKFPKEACGVRRCYLGHILPFALWLAFILLLVIAEALGICPRGAYPWSYAFKTLLCALFFMVFKPWKIYRGPRLGEVGWALLAGTAVAVLWILPETRWLQGVAPSFQTFYYRWMVMMPGGLPDYVDPSTFPLPPVGHISWSYSPEEAGWGGTLMKLAGSAFVIAVIEEFFFRGFLYRWFRNGRFWEVALGRFDLSSFAMVTLVFGLEHDRWVAGCVAGLFYGLLAVRTGSVWPPAIAHVLTNLILGLYVIITRQYGFW